MSGPHLVYPTQANEALEEQSMDWQDQAECLGLDSDLFFPTRTDYGRTVEAKAVCASCPVREECLEYALETQQLHGVWGGTSERERRKLRRLRKVQVAG